MGIKFAKTKECDCAETFEVTVMMFQKLTFNIDASIFFLYLQNVICMHKTKFLMNIFKYYFENYIELHEFANCNSANYDV